LSQFYAEDGDDVRSKVRLVVPNSSCGGIIGKGGATIKYEFLLDSYLISICILRIALRNTPEFHVLILIEILFAVIFTRDAYHHDAYQNKLLLLLLLLLLLSSSSS